MAGFYDWALPPVGAHSSTRCSSPAGSFLVAARLGPPRRRRPRLAYLGAGFVASSFLGLALIFASRPFYSFYETTPRLWGLSPIRTRTSAGS